jgi:Tfp pilus assembly protein PilF
VSFSPTSASRQVIPRWRPLDRTIASRELASPRATHQRSGDIPDELRHRLEKWRFDQGVIESAELVETAVVLGHADEAVNAARALLRGWSGATPMVLKQAALLLQQQGQGIDFFDAQLLSRSDVSSRRPREAIDLNPKDALAWVELALTQTNYGHLKQACESMRIALMLAPHNRHVLRSAARLYVQAHETEQAHWLIRRAPTAPNDPWLMAAEIALASKLERPSVLAKRGSIILSEERHLPRQVSELASALATDLMDGGSNKRAKKLFRESLYDPTGNSLAQAEWASARVGASLVGDAQLAAAGDATEARALKAFDEDGEFEEALRLARIWIKEEPYSVRAHFIGSAAANTLDDHTASVELCRRGLRHDMKSAWLRNSLVFALGSLNLLEEAEAELKILHHMPGTGDSPFVAQANRGLIAFRRGDFAAANAHYRSAIAGFRKQQRALSERLALAYFAREAAFANYAEAPKILQEAETTHKSQSSPQFVRVLASAREVVKRMHPEGQEGRAAV